LLNCVMSNIVEQKLHAPTNCMIKVSFKFYLLPWFLVEYIIT
jgi:hypothetical protein